MQYQKQLSDWHVPVVNEKRGFGCVTQDREIFTLDLRLIEGTLEDEESMHFNEISQFIERLKNERNSVAKEEFFVDGCNRLFLRGIAGIGKTSFVEHLALSWANNKTFTEFDFVFLLKCRVLLNHIDETVEKLFKEMFNVNLASLREQADGERVLIVIDGLDELPSLESVFENNSNGSLYTHLNRLLQMQSEIFPGHKCILTGRPHIFTVLRKHELTTIGKMKVIEITGFNKKTIEKYVDNFTSGDTRTKNAILDKIANYPSLGAIATVPQFLSSLCCILPTQKSLTSHKLTELYIWVLVAFIRQHFPGLPEMPYEMFEDVRFQNFVAKISRISYNLLEENKMIFKEGELSELLATEDDLEKKMLDSFIIEAKTTTGCYYQFKHVSLQEFLAAVYCFERNININTLLDKRWYVLVGFVAGLARAKKSASKNMISVSAIFADCVSSGKYYENFKIVRPTVDHLAQTLLNRLKERHITWRPFFSIFFELFYDGDRLSNSIHFDCELDFSFYYLSTIAFIHFLHFMKLILVSRGKDALSAVSLRIMNNHISLQMYHELDTIVKYFRCFKCINCHVDLEFLESLSMSIQSAGDDFHLRTLAFIRCDQTEADIKSLSNCLPHLESLEISYNELTNACFSTLATRLSKCEEEDQHSLRLREIRFHRCTFGDGSISNLCSVIPYLETLDLTGCTLNKKQVCEIVDCIRHHERDGSTHIKLEELILERCCLDDDCINELCTVIPRLRRVNLSRSATDENQQEFKREIVDNIIRKIELAYFQKQLRLKKLIMHSFSTNKETKEQFIGLNRLGIEVSFEVWKRVSSQKKI